MTTERKVRSLGYIAAFLLLTNLAMLIFFIGLNDGKKTLHLKDNPVGNYLKKDIGFDDKQMEQYQALRKADMDSMRPLFTALRGSKDSFYRFVTIPNASDSDLKTASDEIGRNQKMVDEQMLLHFKKVRALCTADQLIKFDTSFRNVIGRITTGRMKRNYKEQVK